MVVENIANAIKLDSLNFYDGYYYIMPYLLDVKANNEHDYRYKQLLDFISSKKAIEVVLVLSPTIQGEMTTIHLLKLLKSNNIKVTRAAIGMPMGSSVEYLDEFTIKQSIENRKNS
ncbi:UNVERIFIED_CONTAM: toprim domain-containing protein [Campylobacter lari]